MLIIRRSSIYIYLSGLKTVHSKGLQMSNQKLPVTSMTKYKTAEL